MNRADRRRARRSIASLDGLVVRVDACCDLDVHLSATGVAARHDDWCAAVTGTDDGTARALATTAVVRLLDDLGIDATVLVVR